jgi:hypothetical protein
MGYKHRSSHKDDKWSSIHLSGSLALYPVLSIQAFNQFIFELSFLCFFLRKFHFFLPNFFCSIPPRKPFCFFAYNHSHNLTNVCLCPPIGKKDQIRTSYAEGLFCSTHPAASILK